MATPQLSPGVLIREVDLTVGRPANINDNIGAIVGPFSIGPVSEPVDIPSEQDLINVFGKPLSTDAQYEYWMSASSFLSYGGVLKVVRADGANLVNANAARNISGVSTVGDVSLKIKNYDQYEAEIADDDSVNYVFAAKTPGSWANDLKVAFIDDKADQIITIGTTSSNQITVGAAVTSSVTSVAIGVGTTSVFTGYVKAVVTGINTALGTADVKIVAKVESGTNIETPIVYSQRDPLASFRTSTTVGFGSTTASVSQIADWYDEQTINLTNTTIYWKSIAPKPTTTQYALERDSLNDGINIAVFDDTGAITGIRGNLIEKHIGLSKASDAVSAVNSPQKIFWKNYLAQFSNYIYAGDNPSDAGNNEKVYQTNVGLTTAQGLWNLPAQSKTFSALGNVTYTLSGGKDYGANGGHSATLGDLVNGYRLFTNKEEIAVDYLINGPGLTSKFESQAKAQELIAIANQRKDCIAVISPHRADVVDLTNTDVQTDNVIEFFSPLASSSYAIFDSGYKYTYDRFNNKFRYIPTNADIAGLCVRTGINAYPWFSPAGQQRGVLNNAIKLAYSPNKAQRDQLYPLRINAVINQPGVGIILFGDKTALGYASAFDRINVRRLFLTVEQALENVATAQLFELNDQITRANFVNSVEPYLRDVQAKRGVYDFRVICDETNNTPDVIDNNEFRADIFLKPTKSINYVTLTFVATRTGVSFEEVIGRV
jgi:phage tail sheath protein FI